MTLTLESIKKLLAEASPDLCKGEKPRQECDYFGKSLICLSDTYENYESDVDLFWNAPAALAWCLEEIGRLRDACSAAYHAGADHHGRRCEEYKRANRLRERVRELEGTLRAEIQSCPACTDGTGIPCSNPSCVRIKEALGAAKEQG